MLLTPASRPTPREGAATAAFTMIEMLVAIGALGFLVIATMAYFANSSQQLKIAIKSGELQDLSRYLANSIDCQKSVQDQVAQCNASSYVNLVGKSCAAFAATGNVNGAMTVGGYKVRTKCAPLGALYGLMIEYEDGSEWKSLTRGIPIACANDLRFKQIAEGHNHNCGLTLDGKVYRWGNGFNAVPTEVKSVPLVTISEGVNHGCGLTSGGAAFCWGKGGAGQLGNGSIANTTTAVGVNVSGLTGSKIFVSISAGNGATCGVMKDGVGVCWGAGDNGRLGTGSVINQLLPTLVDVSTITGNKKFHSIIMGHGDHTCAIMQDNLAYCWGYNLWTQLGTGTGGYATGVDQWSPSKVDVSAITNPKFSSIAPGLQHTCALISGIPYCWGSNADSALGIGGGSPSYSNRPIAINVSAFPVGTKYLKVAGKSSSCLVTQLLGAYCWGSDYLGKMGNGPMPAGNAIDPTAVVTSSLASGEVFGDAYSSMGSSCFLSNQSKVYCSGSNQFGEFGNGGSPSTSDIPLEASHSLDTCP